MAQPVSIFTRVSEVLPPPLPDQQEDQAVPRSGKDRSLYTLPIFGGNVVAADEGSEFVTTTPTPYTGIIGPVNVGAALTAPGADQTKPTLVITNGAAAKDRIRAYLNWLRFIVSVTSTTNTRLDYALFTDSPPPALSTPATSLTPVNVNADTNRRSVLSINFGAIVKAAATGQMRLVGRGVLRTILPVVGDEYLLKFGSVEGGGNVPNLAVATAACVSKAAPQVILGPQQSLYVFLMATGMTVGLTTELEMSHFER